MFIKKFKSFKKILDNQLNESGPIYEIFTLDEVNDILDIFRNDLVDEYNMIIPNVNEFIPEEISYQIAAWDGRGLFKGKITRDDKFDLSYIKRLRIEIYRIGNAERRKFKDDIDNFQQRLINMNFVVNTDWANSVVFIYITRI